MQDISAHFLKLRVRRLNGISLNLLCTRIICLNSIEHLLNAQIRFNRRTLNFRHGWNCVGCNSNFNNCLAALFAKSQKRYDSFITLEAGKVKNNDGSRPIHKWAVIYQKEQQGSC